MMRSLWTAASGMKTQQLAVDTISNNLANVNTSGFKKERIEFKSLLYETMRTAGDVNESGEPINLQVGHGVRAAGSVKAFSQGNIENTDKPLDFAIQGNGFFVVKTAQNEEQYSKDGAFKLSIYEDGLMLTNTAGNPILDTNGEYITFARNTVADNIVSDAEGKLFYQNGGNNTDLGMQIQLVQFRNTAGLKSLGNGVYQPTVASGNPVKEVEDPELVGSAVIQKAIESSNVQAVEEMVKLIIAQRAYELNSKAIQTSDDMLSLANQLKR